MKFLWYLFQILLVVVMIGCNDSDEQLENLSRQVVVETYITPGDSIKVKVSKILPFETNNTVITTIDTCNIWIIHRNKYFRLIPSKAGLYVYKSKELNINSTDTISIQFHFLSNFISFTTIVPTKPTNFKSSVKYITMPGFANGFNRSSFQNFEPIEFTWNNGDNSYFLLLIKPVDTLTAELINPAETIGERKAHIFKSEPAITSLYRIDPFQFRYYGHNYIILYHLNPENAAICKFTGNTSLDIKELWSNATKALSIFTAINANTL